MCRNHTCWHRSSTGADPGCVKRRLSSTVWRSCVGTKICSSMSRQSLRTCNRLRTLYQFWLYEELIDFQSRFLLKLMSGLKFLSFLVAAAMKFTPSILGKFLRNSGVFCHCSLTDCGHYPSVIMWWLASSCVLVIVGDTSFGAQSSDWQNLDWLG